MMEEYGDLDLLRLNLLGMEDAYRRKEIQDNTAKAYRATRIGLS